MFLWRRTNLANRSRAYAHNQTTDYNNKWPHYVGDSEREVTVLVIHRYMR